MRALQEYINTILRPTKYAKLLNSVLLVIIGLILIYIFSLNHGRVIHIWDEAIYANNSLEMSQTGDLWNFTNNYSIDHYNSKPPLVIWMQAICYKIMGYNELAVRLPSYLALVATLFALFYFVCRITQSSTTSLFTLLLFISTSGVMRPHVFLTGDLDAVLVFFTSMLYGIVLVIAIERKWKIGQLYIIFFLTLLGYLTKSTAIFLIYPGIVIVLILSGQAIEILKSKHTWFLILLFVISVIGFYKWKEHIDPGYFHIVWNSEFKRAFSNVMSWHTQPFSFYFTNLFLHHFFWPLVILLVCSPFYFFSKKSCFKKVVLYSIVLSVSYMLVISIPAVKLQWYDAPVYACLAIAVMTMTIEIFSNISNYFSVHKIWQTIILIVFIGVFLLYQTRPMLAALKLDLNTYQPQEMDAHGVNYWLVKYPKILQIKVLYQIEEGKENHFDVLNFYKKLWKLNFNKSILISQYERELVAQDSFIVCSQFDKIDSLMLKPNWVKCDSFNQVYLFCKRN